MFSYYGSKSKIVHLYPKPKHALIIEPFAGSARYALKYFDRDVLLIDKYPVIVELWNYLKQASEKDILSLPDTKDGCDLRDFNLSDPERHLIYFCSTAGGGGRSGYTVRSSKNGDFNKWHRHKPRIAAQLYKIRHWQIQLGDYTDAPDVEATWFIDPPYTAGGHKYKFSNKELDFVKLKSWLNTRQGQVIVCENSSAKWHDFKPISKNKGICNTNSVEVFWTNEKTEVQEQLF